MLHGTRNRGFPANRDFKKPSLATLIRLITKEMAASTLDAARERGVFLSLELQHAFAAF